MQHMVVPDDHPIKRGGSGLIALFVWAPGWLRGRRNLPGEAWGGLLFLMVDRETVGDCRAGEVMGEREGKKNRAKEDVGFWNSAVCDACLARSTRLIAGVAVVQYADTARMLGEMVG